ncbi:MAG: hypothetical protein LAT51_09325 [Flavobacteriaceae bacterium]|nr:hypothetical protein [Flavobacteriaceae bacterium]
MKKDITIPEVTEVYVAAIYVHNESFDTYEWNVYLINNHQEPIETVLVVSKGAQQKTTSVLRKSIAHLPAKSFAKLEYLHDDLLAIENRFMVTFFKDAKLFDKTFVFPSKSIKTSKIKPLPVVPEKGILAK